MKIVLGYGLQFLGLGLVVLAMFTATQNPVRPLWHFLLLGVLAGAPPIVWGARLLHQGRGTGASYDRATLQMAILLVFALGCGSLVALPVWIMGLGWLPWDVRIMQGWLVAFILALALTHRWLRRWLFDSLEPRLWARWQAARKS